MRAIGAAKIAADSQAMSGRSKPMTHTWTAGLAVIVTGLLCGAVNGEWRNAMKPHGEPAGRLILVEGGKPACVIQCAAQPTGPERKAARDLQQWIREMTGATVEIADVERSGYAKVVTEFERIARRENIQFLQEGGADFEPKLASYKARIPKPASRP